MIIEPIVLHTLLVEGIIVTKHNLKIGATVRRGPDWEWGDEDGNDIGTIVKLTVTNHWVIVKWLATGEDSAARIGLCDKYDLIYTNEDRS